MKTERLNQVLANMEKQGLSQALISDPNSIFYLTGRFIEPGERLLALILKANGGHKLFVNELFAVPEELGVEKVWFSDTDDSLSLLKKALDPSVALGIDKIFPARFLLPLINSASASSFVNVSPCVDNARAQKDAEEQELMRQASRINDLAMAEFKKLVRPNISESELAEDMLAIYKELGAEGYSFEPLVAFGKNAAVGHHSPGNTVLQEGDCVLLDVGCKKDGYCSDMTRTFFYKYISDKNKEIYEIVRKANETAEAAVRPGVKFCELDGIARSIIEKEGYGKQFTHRLGHSIGMEVHEAGDVSSANTNEVLPGMVFSIEPGIYLSGETGVRIEDLVLVTENGCEILNHYSKEIEIIE